MAGLVETRDAAAAYLREKFPDLKVEGVCGAQNASSVLRQAIGRGLVLVMAISAQNAAPQNSPNLDILARFGAVVVIHGKKDATSRENDGLALCEALALAIHGQVFGLCGISPAKLLEIGPIDSDDLSDRGLWAWTIAWEQRLVLNP